MVLISIFELLVRIHESAEFLVEYSCNTVLDLYIFE
jgi:hypothetical protein